MLLKFHVFSPTHVLSLFQNLCPRSSKARSEEGGSEEGEPENFEIPVELT
jgi:hypothetical protein